MTAPSMSAPEPLRIVQVTDSHLGERAGTRLLNLDTDASLDAVLALIAREQPHIDLLLATGDLADQGGIDAYRRFAAAVATSLGSDTAVARCRWLPGNHDDWSDVRQGLGASDIRLQRRILVGDWQLVLLDSTIPGEVGGNLTLSELTALQDCLDAEPDRHALVCLHHHVLPVGAAWLDRQRVANGERLLELLGRFSQVKGLLSGHVHQCFDAVVDGIRVLTSPSTCVQFLQGSAEFRVDAAAAPGYRWLHLYPDGRLETGVSRIDGSLFRVDTTATGY